MRIGIDARAINIYPGIGRYAFNLVRWLGKFDTTNQYVIFKNRLCTERLTNFPNFKEIVVDIPLLSFGTLFTFSKIVLRENIDFLHCAFNITPLSKKMNKIITVHDLMDMLFPDCFSHHPFLIEQGLKYFFKFSTPRTILSAKHLVADSHYTKSEILRMFSHVSPERIDVVHLAVDDYFTPSSQRAIEEFKHKFNLPDKFLLYVGNTKKYKNLNCLIKAYIMYFISKGAKTLPLIIAGMKNVVGDELTKTIDSSGLGEKIKIIGSISEEELPMLYSAAEYFIFPSIYEGFGLPPLEAMSCGTPVIVSNATSIPEVVNDAGLYFDPLHPEELADILINKIDNADLKYSLREKGLKQAKKFTLEKMAMETLSCYKKMII